MRCSEATPLPPIFRVEIPMTGMSWPERIENYHVVLKREPFLTYVDGVRPWVHGYWRLGCFARTREARAVDYHGAYPGDYLRRIAALFPDHRRVLHLFSGMTDLKRMPGDTLDIRSELNPTYCVNAETMPGVPLERYDLVLADPPYTREDAAKYGDTPMVVPGRVMTALERLVSGAYVVWLDEREPTVSKAAFVHEGLIGLSTSAGHRCRQISIFRRV